MLDKFKREINYLRVSITDRCNLRCVYCMPKEGVSLIGHEDILSYEEMLRIIRIASKLGIVKVRVTGGEPLVRRGVTEFLAALGKLGLEDISLTTNGILLESLAEPIRKAGVGRINVSLDSLDPEKYTRITRGGDLAAVLRGLEQADRAGFSPIKINVVTVKGFNDDEAIQFARLTLEKPYEIRFIELMPIGGKNDNTDKYVSNDELMERIGRRGQAPARRGRQAGEEPRWAGPAFPARGRPGGYRLHQPHQPQFLPRLQPVAAHGGRRSSRLPDGRRGNRPQDASEERVQRRGARTAHSPGHHGQTQGPAYRWLRRGLQPQEMCAGDVDDWRVSARSA